MIYNSLLPYAYIIPLFGFINNIFSIISLPLSYGVYNYVFNGDVL